MKRDKREHPAQPVDFGPRADLDAAAGKDANADDFPVRREPATRMTGTRLVLRPLSAAELLVYADEPSRLAESLQCLPVPPHPDFFRAIVRRQAERASADPDNLGWHTFYLMIDPAERAVVGSIDFKNIPSTNGTVEIGYGVDDRWRGRGYATEAAAMMADAAFATGRVRRVVAETEDGNPASDRVLLGAGFRFFRKDGISNWYERRIGE